MRHQSALFLLKTCWVTTVALLLGAGAQSANAQAITFDDLDWLLDRGSITRFLTSNNGHPLRQGYNNFNTTGNHPMKAVARWEWPFTRDLAVVGNRPTYLYVDNPNISDPTQPRIRPGFTPGLALPQTLWSPGWVIPPPADRAPNGGFSFDINSNQGWSSDYGYVLSQFSDFSETGARSFAEVRDLLRPLPNVAPNVYAAVNNKLLSVAQDTAVWSSGQVAAGRYEVSLFSPGDGTTVTQGFTRTVNPSVRYAFVRVSWRNTMTDANVLNQPGVNDRVNSRLFLVDLSQAGWIKLRGGGLGPASFPYDGSVNNQLVVTLYTLSFDPLTGSAILAPPVVTADAVRFVPQMLGNPFNPNDHTLQPPATTRLDDDVTDHSGFSVTHGGRMLGAIAGTNKFPGAGNETAPYYYIAREEPKAEADIKGFLYRSYADPGDITTGKAPDPTALTTIPVFYCLDNKNGNLKSDGITKALDIDLDKLLSKQKILWRYEGVPDVDVRGTALVSNLAGDQVVSGGTSSASPLLANVRCRDGQVRPMLYFVTTNLSNSIGHIYALNPVGNHAKQNTSSYWVYPSYRPLSDGEWQTGMFAAQYHDPNYRNSTPGIYPLPNIWGADQAIPFLDGDLVQSASGATIVQPDTQISFGGMLSSPMLMDDPDNLAGAQMLVVGNMNGHLFAFDAGGRGDLVYDPKNPGDATKTIPGTTQRLWAWPRFAGDKYHWKGLTGVANPFKDDDINSQGSPLKVAFPTSPATDPDTPGGPIVVGAVDGHVYSITSKHDSSNISINGEPIFLDRLNWTYPDPKISLKATPSTTAIFTPSKQLGFAKDKFVYFTAGGRAYSIPLKLPIGISSPGTQALNWVFPYTPNVPDPDPNDDTTVELEQGFGGSAPIVAAGTTINPNDATTSDGCFVVLRDGTIIKLDTIPTAVNSQKTTLLALGATNGGGTRCSPVGTIITGDDNQLGGLNPLPTGSTNVPAILITDDDGTISAISMVSTSDPQDVNNEQFLPLLWEQLDAGPRSAAAAVVGGDRFNNAIDGGNSHGMILSGDELGQLHAYGIGDGLVGEEVTTGTEPSSAGGFLPWGGGNPGGRRQRTGFASIDARQLNLYRPQDAAGMGKDSTFIGQVYTPGVSQTDGHFMPGPAGVQPKAGNIAPNSSACAVDWGDKLYLVMWGVYHALPNNGGPETAGIPNIRAHFIVQQAGVASQTYQTNANPVTPNGASGIWPDDIAFPDAERQLLSIYGRAWGDANWREIKQPEGTVYPWVAVKDITITPNAQTPYTPGSLGFRVSGYATITQSVNGQEVSDQSNTLSSGQRNYKGMSGSQRRTSVNLRGRLGRQRRIFIAHPIGLTVAGANGGDQNMTGQPNVIGWGADPSTIGANGIHEILGNGNRVVNPLGTGLNTGIVIKPLFAPIPMAQDGTTQSYHGIDQVGNPVEALFAVDRSNYSKTSGRTLAVKIFTQPLQWQGGPSSVMNPLPWEKFPQDSQAPSNLQEDYPNISADNLQLTINGQNIANLEGTLTPPIYDTLNPNRTDNRTIAGTPIQMTVKVPKYQPANANRGPVSFTYQGKTYNYGEVYEDIAGNQRGSLLAGPIVGPIFAAGVSRGNYVGLNSPLAFPAGGYMARLTMVAAIPNLNIPRLPSDGLYQATNITYRQLETGVSVPPTIRMRVEEQTVDIGKAPHGTGYSDLDNVSGFYRAPFTPGGTKDWPGTSPWDAFFRPFTLINDSNVNLLDVRIAKLIGLRGADIGPRSLTNNTGSFARAARLESDQLDNLTGLPLFAVPFGGVGVGNIGVVSSFDHRSSNSAKINEHSLWPIQNPFVSGAEVAHMSNVGIVDATMNWADGLQGQPTIHKPRVGDSVGTTATIPDVRYDFNPTLLPNFGNAQPKVSIAVPLGTPTGTYANPIYPFEDNMPLQWREWLVTTQGLSNSGDDALGVAHDGLLNIQAGSGSPTEIAANPTFTLKVTTKEARLTEGVTSGTLSQIDPPLLANNADPFGKQNYLPLGANMLPAVYFNPLNDPAFGTSSLALFWATNRQPTNSPSGIPAGSLRLPAPQSPWSLAYSRLPMPFSNIPFPRADANFARSGSGNVSNAVNGLTGLLGGSWWTDPTPYPGYDSGTGLPNFLNGLFPSTNAEAQAVAVNGVQPPFLPGERTAQTTKHASPAVAYNTRDASDGEAYLFWQGSIDKVVSLGGVGSQQQTDTRTFYANLKAGIPDGNPLSFTNDPALTKLSPKPLLVKQGPNKILFLFWHAGNQAKTALYYNYNVASAGGTFETKNWSKDIKLGTPSGLSWQSDPYPLYRVVTVGGQAAGVVDVAYTGVLKGRQTTETLLSRYAINLQPVASASNAGILSERPIPLPTVVQEELSRVGSTRTWVARDAGWVLPENNTEIVPPPVLQIDLVRKGVLYHLTRQAGSTTQNESGQYDPASGMVYFDLVARDDNGATAIANGNKVFSGGQMVVDLRAGTISFPLNPPSSDDRVLATYLPRVMRLNTSRDATNVISTAGNVQAVWGNDPLFREHPAITSSGSSTSPVVILDKGSNVRFSLTAPQVGSISGNVPVDRMWVIYRKTDTSSNSRATLYYKAMRLMVHLPRPVKLTAPDNNGNQQIANMTVTGNKGPYEVDWVRGRIYFTEIDEGSVVQVSYTPDDKVTGKNASGNLVYRVAWGDEISVTANPGDTTTPEVVVPTDQAVNEGQVSAFKDPFSDKVWLFWTSMRDGTADLYYQTVAPAFYPVASNQR